MSFVVLNTLYRLITALLSLAYFLVIATVVVSWLVAFGVLNMNNQFVRQIVRGIDAVTDPILRPIRRIIPPIGGLDFSPVILLIILYVLQVFVDNLFTYLMYGAPH
jgi:YggT family protein